MGGRQNRVEGSQREDGFVGRPAQEGGWRVYPAFRPDPISTPRLIGPNLLLGFALLISLTQIPVFCFVKLGPLTSEAFVPRC